MAKESSKAPETAASSQIGSAGMAPTSPGTPPAPAIPPVPLKARSVNPQEEIIHRNMLGATLTLEEPAQGTLSAVATRRWGELCVELGFGTPRVPKARVGFDDSKRFLYLAPTTKNDPLGLEVRYEKSSVIINLLKAFAPNHRYVAPGRRELYNVRISPGKVEFEDGFQSVSLYVYLAPVKEEPRKKMSEESIAKRRATLARKKQAKQEQAKQEPAQQEQAPAAADAGEEQE